MQPKVPCTLLAFMKFINIRKPGKSPSRYIKNANEESDVIVTRNGLPYAILSRIDGSELEDYLLAKHFDLKNNLKSQKKNSHLEIQLMRKNDL